MRRATTLAISIWLVLAAMFGASAIAPEHAYACSCAPTTLADYAADPEVSVFVGTAGAQMGDRIPVAVGAWYRGGAPSELVWLTAASTPDGRGGMIFDTCGLDIQPGQRWLFIAYGGPPRPYSASNCSPSMLLRPDNEAAGLAEAERAFGPARALPSLEAKPEQPISAELSGEPTAWGWLLGALVAAAGVLLAAVLFGRRRRPLS